VPEVQLNDSFFQKTAGWEAVQHARALLGAGKVLSSNWTPPLLKGVVQAGETSYRSGLVINSSFDVENICTCRAAREDGTICAHSVAVGLHHLKGSTPPVEAGGKPGRHTGLATGRPAAPAVARHPVRLARAENGEPLTISVIFPPNLAESVARGRAMLVLEGTTRRGRGPLNALVKAGPFALAPEDARLLDAAELAAGGDTPGMMQLPAKDFLALLPHLAGHPRLSIGRDQPLTVSREPAPLPLRAALEDTGEITLWLKPGTRVPQVFGDGANAWALTEVKAAPGRPETTGTAAGRATRTTLAPLALAPQFREVLQREIRLPRTQVPQFLSQDWPRLAAVSPVECNFRLEDFQLSPQAPKFILNLAGGLAQLSGTLQCAYGPRIMTVGVTAKEESAWLPDPANPRRYSTRDLGSEHKAYMRLRAAGFTGPNAQGQWQLTGQDQVVAFFAREFPRLEREWQVALEERLERSTEKNFERITPEFRVLPSGEQWFDLEVGFKSGTGERFSAADIQQLLRGGGRKLRNGKFALIDSGAVEELQEVLLDCAPQQRAGTTDPGVTRYRMGTEQAGFLDATLQEQGFTVAAPPQWREQVRQQTGEAKLVCPPLGSLDAVLRPYQKHGVAWLRFLRDNRFGGVLADEMGLGKTLQVLTHLSTIVGRASRPSSNFPAPAPVAVLQAKTKRDAEPTARTVSGEGDNNEDGRDARPTLAMFKAFDPSRPASVSLRHLPHWRQDGTTYFVTYRLGDSLPAEKIGRWQAERDAWIAEHPRPWTAELAEEFHDRFGERLNRWLDAGEGSCLLKRPDLAEIVEGSLRHFDSERYVLDWFVVMPNHVHALVTPLASFELGQILQGWRSFTAHQINKLAGRTGPLWQDEVFDHIVRSSAAWEKFADYIRKNPANARLTAGQYRVGHGSGVRGEERTAPVLSAPGSASVRPEKTYNEDGRDARPTLVICPTSLVFNWAAEAAKFTPELRVLTLNGPDRHADFGRIPQSDLVITSYALIRRDAERYRGLEFDTVVLDEAQHIKNRQTQNAVAVKSIRSAHRLVLTGTPLENSVLDLWSLYDFLMPGYLGTAQDFRERYELPITKEKDAASIARLAKRVKPFLLRRLKRDVAKDLPAKLEQVAWCDLTQEQATVYQQLLSHTRKEVLAAVGEQGLAKSRMLVLTALLRLRQVCCDLRLLKPADERGAGEADAPAADTSGKLQLFGELLDEIVDGGHRVLVFSQFTSMLALLREELAARELDHCYLDGSTKDRGAVVERFQGDETVPVFLISLKAGGVGLNLTGADTVIHFDPWWNPAVEDQATDRAHRIGQTRVVTNYKLITRGTVEEKILNLQRKKREIIAATLTGEEAFAESLSWDEIQELLS
jgi:superfamily II DNA or RNA helicase/REP element-mobilizing transposase RayT